MNKAEKSAYNRAYAIANKERIAAKRAARRAGLGENARRCSIPGCDGIYDSHGMCGKHYMAFLRNGNPTLVVQVQHHGMSVAERLALRTKKGPKCWEWTGAKNRAGYGVMRDGQGNNLAHRIAWTLRHGAIQKGMFVLHRCDNPACVRVSHLFIGSLADNNADMRAKGRQRGPSLKGSANPNAKLTEDTVRKIRASNTPGSEIARQLGVSQTIISAARKGHSWKHVK